jgi:hypothetical protein
MKIRVFVCAIIFAALTFQGANSGGEKKPPVPVQQMDGGNLAMFGKARLEAAEKAYKAWFAHEMGGGGQNGMIYQRSVQWRQAEIDLSTKKEDRILAYTAHLNRMKAWEDEARIQYQDKPNHAYMLVTVSCRKEAEYWVAKERAGK